MPTEFSSRKALLIGINYIGSKNQLEGCINDAKNIKKVLVDKFGFREHEIQLLTEDHGLMPTKKNIVASIKSLYEDAGPNSLRVFHYSGHGTQVHDETGTEPDGKNEAICPVDCMDEPWPARLIVDDDLHKLLYDGCPDGVSAFCFFDCCHSGTVMDLGSSDDPVAARANEGASIEGLPGGPGRHLPPPDEVKQKMVDAKLKANRWPTGQKQKLKIVPHTGQYSSKNLWTFSGCQDNQTSADATIGSTSQGAATWSLLTTLKERNFNVSCHDLLEGMRAQLRKGSYSQIPALSCQDPSLYRFQYLGNAPVTSYLGNAPLSPLKSTSSLPAPSYQADTGADTQAENELTRFVTNSLKDMQGNVTSLSAQMFLGMDQMDALMDDLEKSLGHLVADTSVDNAAEHHGPLSLATSPHAAHRA